MIGGVGTRMHTHISGIRNNLGFVTLNVTSRFARLSPVGFNTSEALKIRRKGMRWVLTAILSGLMGCGMSAEEKTNIALATCNLLPEYSETDSVARIKEVNSARDRLKQPLFVGSGKDIKEALDYDLCADLILNDSDYSTRLAQAKKSRVEKFQRLLDGTWFFNRDWQFTEPFFIVAEFEKENLILSKYSYNDAGQHVKLELNFRAQVLSESAMTGSGSGADDIFIHVDWDNETIQLSAFECAVHVTCNLRKAPQVSLSEIRGKWGRSEPRNADGDLFFAEYLEDSLRYHSRSFDHTNKTFADDVGVCEFGLESGFIIFESCEGFDPNFYPITKYSTSSMEVFAFGETDQEQRLRDDYQFPRPPAGYKKVPAK